MLDYSLETLGGKGLSALLPVPSKVYVRLPGELQEINRRIQSDVTEFLAECDENYAQRVSLAADKILSIWRPAPSSCCPAPPAPARPPPP